MIFNLSLDACLRVSLFYFSLFYSTFANFYFVNVNYSVIVKLFLVKISDDEYEKIYVRKETYPNFYMDRFISKFVLKNASSLPEEALHKAFRALIDEA